VNQPKAPYILPILLGSLRQEKAEGTLTLEQNDGKRTFYWENGQLIHLQSSVAGEQLGNYLLRQGVLDFPALSELLANEEHFRLGEKVVQWGLMTIEERDLHLNSLQEQVMIHALEHTLVEVEWKPGEVRNQLSGDLRSRMDHRHFIWNTFQEAHEIKSLSDQLYGHKDWRWSAESQLLESLSDLPLTPQVAYTLSLLGVEPFGYEMLISLSGLSEEEGARLILALWALGGIQLTSGEVRSFLPRTAESPATESPAAKLPTPEVPAVEPVPTPTPRILLATPSAAPVHPPTIPVTPPSALPPLPEPLSTIPLDFLPMDPKASPEIEVLAEEIPASYPTVPLLEEAPAQEDSVARARKCFLKAKALLLQDRTAEAIRFLEESVRLDPDTDQAYDSWLLLGKHRLTNPAWSTRAIEALQAASRLKPKHGEPWALMGELYHRKGFTANANACFKKALELDPSVPVPADVIVKEDPSDEEPKSLLGRFRSMLGRPDRS